MDLNNDIKTNLLWNIKAFKYFDSVFAQLQTANVSPEVKELLGTCGKLARMSRIQTEKLNKVLGNIEFLNEADEDVIFLNEKDVEEIKWLEENINGAKENWWDRLFRNDGNAGGE